MYESHFGLTGAPFSLNADPAFFFGTSGHSNALSYLKFGVYQGEGFVVVTGEIGAGKTMLVRTLLAGLESEPIVAAQIVSTQLEAGDLLRSIALAFGIAPKKLSKAELIATIEAFLMLLATENKRALLIVDEAQNLEPAAVEELRMLSNFQLGNQALLQSFLIGQPELRTLLTSKSMEQFRQRVIAACHLGSMTAAETRSYIEHRLRRVGWTGTPTFSDDVVERIFYWSGGIPRRVNLLCNRLLLALFLAGGSRLDAALVDVVGEEMRVEIGAPAEAPRQANLGRAPAAPAAAKTAFLAARRAESTGPRAAAWTGPLVVVAGARLDEVKAVVFLQAWKKHSPLRQAVRVRVGSGKRGWGNDDFCAHLDAQAPVLDCEVRETSPIARIGEVAKQFTLVLEKLRPGAVAVIGVDDAALACSLAVHKMGCRLIHLEAGIRSPWSAEHDTGNGALIDRVAQVFYPSQSDAYLNLVREGARDANVLCAGSLLADAVSNAVREPPRSSALVLSRRDGRMKVDLGHGYGVVELADSFAAGPLESIAQLISMLHELSRDKPLIWLLDDEVWASLDPSTLRDLAAHERIDVVAPLGFVDGVELLRGAAFVVTDSVDVQLQAAVLRVRCLWSGPERPGEVAANAAPQARADAAQRIADHLAHWMAVRPAALP